MNWLSKVLLDQEIVKWLQKNFIYTVNIYPVLHKINMLLYKRNGVVSTVPN